MENALPSLELLRVFEACARHLSFTAAAAELGTSQPAISQQIRRLEQALAVRLFERVHRSIALSAAGAELLDHVQDALASVRAGVEAVTARPAREVLAVATDFAFAAYWLMPRLSRFYELHPQLDVSLTTSNRALVNLGAEVDLAIAFGDGSVTRGESLLLFREEVFPVCSPQWLARQAGRERSSGDAGIASLPLLQLKSAPGQHWYDWPALFRALDLGTAPAPVQPAFDNYTLVVGAALAGRGVAIGWRHLVDDLLQQGLLCRLSDRSVASSYGYHLLLPQRKRRVGLVRRFVDWVLAELQAQPG